MFIRDMSCISPQASYYGDLFENGAKNLDRKKLHAEEPQYRGIIPNSLLRRMSKLVRMSVGTG